MVSEAQQRASARYKEKHPDKRRLYQYRSNARTFIRKYARAEDIAELKELIRQWEEHRQGSAGSN